MDSSLIFLAGFVLGQFYLTLLGYLGRSAPLRNRTSDAVRSVSRTTLRVRRLASRRGEFSGICASRCARVSDGWRDSGPIK